jgi:hypothetical protein
MSRQGEQFIVTRNCGPESHVWEVTTHPREQKNFRDRLTEMGLTVNLTRVKNIPGSTLLSPDY